MAQRLNRTMFVKNHFNKTCQLCIEIKQCLLIKYMIGFVNAFKKVKALCYNFHFINIILLTVIGL